MESYLGQVITTVTEDYLSDKFPMVEMETNIMINASYLPNAELVAMIQVLEEHQAIFHNEQVIAFFQKNSRKLKVSMILKPLNTMAIV